MALAAPPLAPTMSRTRRRPQALAEGLWLPASKNHHHYHHFDDDEFPLRAPLLLHHQCCMKDQVAL